MTDVPTVETGGDANPAPDSVVSLRDVVVLIGAFPALAGASLEVGRGEVVLLAGPNGAGKTTLLRTCAGLARIERGDGSVLGLDLRSQFSDVRRRTGLVGHSNGLYPDLTVRENVVFWGRTVGATDDEVESALSRMDLAGRLRDVVAGRLSAGQKRRVALAALIARRAELWLLDEPHAGLDAAGRDELDALLGAAVTAGATVIMASHELDRAGRLASRRVEVVAGRVVETPPAGGAR